MIVRIYNMQLRVPSAEFNRMVNLEQNGNTITAELAPLLNWQARQMALHLWEIIISSKFQKN